MDTTSQDGDRRTVGQHIGAALRHAREACRLNLAGAPLHAVRREASKAVDCLGALVWTQLRGERDG